MKMARSKKVPDKLKAMTFGKRALSIRLDIAVIDFFKASGPLWQTRINEVLRRFMEEESK